jgi:hypothetical protein
MQLAVGSGSEEVVELLCKALLPEPGRPEVFSRCSLMQHLQPALCALASTQRHQQRLLHLATHMRLIELCEVEVGRQLAEGSAQELHRSV